MNLFENSYIELHNNTGKLFIDGKEVISFNYENDGWYGFKFKKKNWDLNIWENEDVNISQATVYRVIKGNTKTDTWYNIPIKTENTSLEKRKELLERVCKLLIKAIAKKEQQEGKLPDGVDFEKYVEECQIKFMNLKNEIT